VFKVGDMVEVVRSGFDSATGQIVNIPGLDSPEGPQFVVDFGNGKRIMFGEDEIKELDGNQPIFGRGKPKQ